MARARAEWVTAVTTGRDRECPGPRGVDAGPARGTRGYGGWTAARRVRRPDPPRGSASRGREARCDGLRACPGPTRGSRPRAQLMPGFGTPAGRRRRVPPARQPDEPPRPASSLDDGMVDAQRRGLTRAKMPPPASASASKKVSIRPGCPARDVPRRRRVPELWTPIIRYAPMWTTPRRSGLPVRTPTQRPDISSWTPGARPDSSPHRTPLVGGVRWGEAVSGRGSRTGEGTRRSREVPAATAQVRATLRGRATKGVGAGR